MKKTLIIFICSILSQFTMAQCDGLRYRTEVFDTFTVYKNLKYGQNFGYDATQGQSGTAKDTISLKLDVYTPPATDTNSNRPTIFFTHGGTFLNGTKDDAEIVFLCKKYAKKGYVCVSIDYRVGYEQPIDSIKAYRTVFRALQDGRAAVRYIRRDAAKYGINKNKIYFGGTSAGGFVGVNMGYLNLPKEVPSFMDTSAHNILTNPQGIDGLEGKTNDIKESSEIQGIINFCGATGKLEWLEDAYSRSLPMVSLHGTKDETVPYGFDLIRVQGVDIIKVHGSYSMDKKQDALGIKHTFYTWCGAPHVPYIDYTSAKGKLYMDTLESILNKFLYENLAGCGPTEGMDSNYSCIDPPQTNTISTTFKTKNSLYPNITTEGFTINNTNGALNITIYNNIGQNIFSKNINTDTYYISTNLWNKGIYFVKMHNGTEVQIEKIIVQ